MNSQQTYTTLATTFPVTQCDIPEVLNELSTPNNFSCWFWNAAWT